MASMKERLRKLEEKKHQKDLKITVVFAELNPDYQPKDNERVVVFRSAVPGVDFEPSEHYRDRDWD